jgi:hypothetical protein
MAQEWYYARDNEPQGPISAAELRRLAGAGQLRPDDLVWHEGLTEWSAARNVRGLFEEENKSAGESSTGPAAGSVAQDSPSTAAIAAPQPVAAVTTAPPAGAVAAPPVRHFLDGLLDGLRRRFDAARIEKTAKVFWACGLFGLFFGMAAVAVLESILALIDPTERWPHHLLWAVQSILSLAVLQYAATRCSDGMKRLFRPGVGALASSVLPDCFALLSALTGITVFLWAMAVFPHFPSLVLGLGALATFGYLAAVALHPAAIGVSIVPEVAAGEEAIGILSFLLRALLRAVPVAFGVGVVFGALMIAYVCGLGLWFSGGPKAAGAGAQAAESVLSGILRTASLARGVLLYTAVLPLAAYMVFLLGSLVLGLWHAVLNLPTKIDRLAAKNRE